MVIGIGIKLVQFRMLVVKRYVDINWEGGCFIRGVKLVVTNENFVLRVLL